MAASRLIGDIGGTNARFAIAVDGVPCEMALVSTSEYPTFAAALEHYLSGRSLAADAAEAAFAVAGPVEGDRVAMTNRAWTFSISALKERFRLRRLDVINDFTACALSLPFLARADLEQVGGGVPEPGRPIAVLGPGTGLGVSGLIRGPRGWIPLSGEGGHATVPAETARESLVIDRLRERYGHVSAERLLSGQGLIDLHRELSALDGVPSKDMTPAQIADAALAESDPVCGEAVEMFCGVLGMVAGNLALTLGARGGVYVAGGIVPRLDARFAKSQFRFRFEAKGRMSAYVSAIPTFVILHQAPALVGLANAA